MGPFLLLLELQRLSLLLRQCALLLGLLLCCWRLMPHLDLLSQQYLGQPSRWRRKHLR